LRDWAEELLNERRLVCQGFLDAARIRQEWREHLDEKNGGQSYLWNVFMFQSWLAENRL